MSERNEEQIKNFLRYVASPDLWQLLGLRHVSRGLPWPPWVTMAIHGVKKSDTELTALKIHKPFMIFHVLRNITAECRIFRALVWLVWSMNMCLPGFKLLWAMCKMLSDRCGSLCLFHPTFQLVGTFSREKPWNWQLRCNETWFLLNLRWSSDLVARHLRCRQRCRPPCPPYPPYLLYLPYLP